MKKKVLKIIALIVALALIAGIAWVANGLNGNPISKMLAKRAANEYLAEHFPDTDYYIQQLGFSFKFSNYYAHVRSETSMDTQFTLDIDMLGNVYFDTYESVTGGFVTARRVEQEYRELTDQIFENPAFIYKSDIQYGTLEIYPQEAFEDPLVTDIPDYALVQDDLILDKIYDIQDLGRKAGHLIVYVDSDTISFELAAEILLDIVQSSIRPTFHFGQLILCCKRLCQRKVPEPVTESILTISGMRISLTTDLSNALRQRMKNLKPTMQSRMASNQ